MRGSADKVNRAPVVRVSVQGVHRGGVARTGAQHPSVRGDSRTSRNGALSVGDDITKSDGFTGHRVRTLGVQASRTNGYPGTMHAYWKSLRDRPLPDTVRPVVPEPEPPVPSQPPAAEPELTWESNFDSIEQAQQDWQLQTGRWGESAGENQYYTDEGNVWVTEDGILVIEARRETPPDGRGSPDDYTSARVVTYDKFSVEPNSRIVARMKMPYTEGTLPAFWMVGEEPGHEFDWPRQGEIDIVELPGMGTDAGSRTWTGNIHGPAAWDNTVDVKLQGVQQDLGVDLSQDFHEYGIDWYDDRIIWHVDGAEVGRVTRGEYEAMGGDWTAFSGAWPHYLIMNVAVGNPWTGDPDPTEPFGAQQLQVDWVRVYELESR